MQLWQHPFGIIRALCHRPDMGSHCLQGAYFARGAQLRIWPVWSITVLREVF